MTEDGILEVGNRSFEIANAGKVLFPDAGISKGELIDYYRAIAETMLPHLRGRAITLQRFPDGIDAEGFFQKDRPDHFPDWIASARLPKENGTVDYVLVDNEATLAYLANQGTITLHMALAPAEDAQRPDRLVFDLDPSDDDFAKVQRAAAQVREALAARDLPSFVQSTGSRGLHVVVPLRPGPKFDVVRDFARALADDLAAAHPDALTVEHRKDKRGKRIFLDTLRNAYGQTMVAPYAVRARAEASCATPLDWGEALARDLTPRRYTVRNMARRLGQKPDPWAEIDRHAVLLNL
jgi:bifunctional non-homologous end joining protein LigD